MAMIILSTTCKSIERTISILYEVWSVDFMTNALWSGRRFRAFNELDNFNHEALCIEIDTSLLATRIVWVLNELIKMCGKPKRLQLDSGPDSTARSWFSKRGARGHYDSFNSTNQHIMLKSSY